MQILPLLVAAARNCGQLPKPQQAILSKLSELLGNWAGLVARVTDRGTFCVCSPFTNGQLGECLSCSDLGGQWRNVKDCRYATVPNKCIVNDLHSPRLIRRFPTDQTHTAGETHGSVIPCRGRLWKDRGINKGYKHLHSCIPHWCKNTVNTTSIDVALLYITSCC